MRCSFPPVRSTGYSSQTALAEPLECRRLLSAGPAGAASAVLVQPDGKVVAGGKLDLPNSRTTFGVVRYTASGSLDRSFSGDGVASGGPPAATYSEVLDVVRQSDGKIVAVGRATVGGNSRFALARYNTNGSLDRTFGGDGFFTIDFGPGTDIASAVAIDPRNGRIVVAGTAFVNGSADMAVARVNRNGTLDTTFDRDGKRTVDVGGRRTDAATSVLVQGDGKVIAGGSHLNAARHLDFAVIRLRADGSLDSTWDGDGKKLVDFAGGHDAIRDLAFGPVGSVIAVGSAHVNLADGSTDAAFALARFTSRGVLDRAFGGGDGKVATEDFDHDSNDFWSGVVVQANGRIVTAGFDNFFDGDGAAGVAARYLPDGRLDPTFVGRDGSSPGFTRFDDPEDSFVPFDVAVQGTKFVFAGIQRDDPDSPFHFSAFRLNADGTTDHTFGG